MCLFFVEVLTKIGAQDGVVKHGVIFSLELFKGL